MGVLTFQTIAFGKILIFAEIKSISTNEIHQSIDLFQFVNMLEKTYHYTRYPLSITREITHLKAKNVSQLNRRQIMEMVQPMYVIISRENWVLAGNCKIFRKNCLNCLRCIRPCFTKLPFIYYSDDSILWCYLQNILLHPGTLSYKHLL